MIGPPCGAKEWLRLSLSLLACGWLPERVRGWPPYVAATPRSASRPLISPPNKSSVGMGIQPCFAAGLFHCQLGFNTQNCRRLDSVSEDQRR